MILGASILVVKTKWDAFVKLPWSWSWVKDLDAGRLLGDDPWKQSWQSRKETGKVIHMHYGLALVVGIQVLIPLGTLWRNLERVHLKMIYLKHGILGHSSTDASFSLIKGSILPQGYYSPNPHPHFLAVTGLCGFRDSPQAEKGRKLASWAWERRVAELVRGSTYCSYFEFRGGPDKCNVCHKKYLLWDNVYTMCCVDHQVLNNCYWLLIMKNLKYSCL